MTMRAGVWLAAGAALLIALGVVHAGGYVRSAPAEESSVTAAQLIASTWQPRAEYGHRLEPTGTVLHGAGQSDGESFERYSSAMPAGARPLLFMSYVDLRADLPAYFARLKVQLDSLPQFALPQIGLSLNSDHADSHYEASVAAGDDDARLAQLCIGLRSLGRPVFLRPGYEFNGPWNGYQPRSYAAAFRRIAAGVRSCDAGNIAMVWDINAGAAKLTSADTLPEGVSPEVVMRARWAAFYPGDDVVDWWGINLFAADDLTSSATQAFLTDAAHHRMPVMVAESTSQHVPVSGGAEAVREWFAPYFGLIRATPGIKAFCYIDWEWGRYPQWADWGDDRVETDPSVLAFYSKQVTDSHVASARARESTLQLVRTR